MKKLRKLMTRTKKNRSIDGPQKTKGKSPDDISLKEDEETFVVHHIEGKDEQAEKIMRESTVVSEEPHVAEKVKVKFDNFVQLVANHNYEDVINKNLDEDVIVSSNLLADLANAHEQEEERRIPAIFIVGVVLGIVITYILLTF